MREGSYAEIEPGMRVVGRDGETIGAVHEVVADEQSAIFVGLAVRPNLFTHSLFIPGDRVERFRDGVVYVDALQGELSEYVSPEEKAHDTAQAYSPANR
jgi:sporulation protein YlmC with PRC-barrel domain